VQLINKYSTGEEGKEYTGENKGKEIKKGKSKSIEKDKHDKDKDITGTLDTHKKRKH